MKKFVLFLTLIILTIAFCVGAERPRWVGQPIHVYIPNDNTDMAALMRQAFMAWQNNSKSLIRFKFVGSQNNADIIVEFTDFVANCGDANSVGCTEMSTRGGEYYKAYVTIGTKEYKRDYTNGKYTRKIVTRTKNHIYGVMLHEAGHAIGLEHSENKDSIMYPYDLDTMQNLTKEDMKILYKKYH